MPYKRHQTLQRLKHLKNKLEINPNFFDHYKKLIEEFFQRSEVYGQKYTKPLAESKYWYFLHHGVYGESKLNKTLHVQTMNSSLEQIIEVLMRFQQELIAMLANIQSVFYQVCVPEEYQNFLRLL